MAGRIKQWAGKLTGFSTPLLGASWQPTATERDVAAELLARFEDRRVLYNPSDAEVPDHCVQSVIELRRLLSDALVKLGGDGVLAEHIRALAAALRKFLDRIGRYDGDLNKAREPGHWMSWDFLDALGQLRAIFGIHIAMIAARYNLAVRGHLQAILPAEPSHDDLRGGHW